MGTVSDVSLNPDDAGTLYAPDLINGVTPHLWIVLTDSDTDGNVAIVNVTDYKNHADQTTILKVGDHPFITKDSIVLYQDARIVPRASLLNALKSGKGCSQHAQCPQALMERLKVGVFASDWTPNNVIDFCHKAWNRF